MSHEISFNKNGSAAAFYARKPAWHKLGEVTVSELTAREAMKATGLDYGVDGAIAGAMINGVFVPMTDASGNATHKMNYKVDVDDSGNEVPMGLGIVGIDRETPSPAELFDFLDEVVGDVDGAHYAAMFALRNFKQIVGVVDMGTLTLDVGGRADIIARFLIGRSSTDASWLFGAKYDNIRADCANMMAVHLRKAGVEFTTRHTTNLRVRMEEAKKMLGLFNEYQQEFADTAETLIEAEITMDQAVKFIDGLFENYGKKIVTMEQGPGAWTADDKDTDAILQTRVNYEFSPINDRVRGTVWGALNAATEYVDWFLPTRGGKKTTADEALVLRQMGDTKSKYGNDFKQFAWEYAGEFAEDTKKKVVAV